MSRVWFRMVGTVAAWEESRAPSLDELRQHFPDAEPLSPAETAQNELAVDWLEAARKLDLATAAMLGTGTEDDE